MYFSWLSGSTLSSQCLVQVRCVLRCCNICEESAQNPYERHTKAQRRSVCHMPALTALITHAAHITDLISTSLKWHLLSSSTSLDTSNAQHETQFIPDVTRTDLKAQLTNEDETYYNTTNTIMKEPTKWLIHWLKDKETPTNDPHKE